MSSFTMTMNIFWGLCPGQQLHLQHLLSNPDHPLRQKTGTSGPHGPRDPNQVCEGGVLTARATVELLFQSYCSCASTIKVDGSRWFQDFQFIWSFLIPPLLG
ncbi:hypothetical protein ILYODFUR_018918 [Ilyodon furcidens]|uniref:Uncharacterized protein n=1 Tax=Ilyodon furcidens TaxID=33524 RepID=A0ABV0T9M6_9TELE